MNTEKIRIMKTNLELEKELEEKQRLEALRLLNGRTKQQALDICSELAKNLPNINDTPPIRRMPDECYMQFYMFGVPNAINSITKYLEEIKFE